MRKLIFGKYGIKENPVGYQVTWENGRTWIADVVGVRYDHNLGTTLLQTRLFCGEPGPEVVARIVNVLEREYSEEPA